MINTIFLDLLVFLHDACLLATNLYHVHITILKFFPRQGSLSDYHSDFGNTCYSIIALAHVETSLVDGIAQIEILHVTHHRMVLLSHVHLWVIC